MKRKLIAFVILATSSCGYAATKDVTMNLVDSDGKERNIVNATMFDRYLPFSCPLKYFRY
ncbi:hypothetical protein ACRW4U_25125 [Escherichia coli]